MTVSRRDVLAGLLGTAGAAWAWRPALAHAAGVAPVRLLTVVWPHGAVYPNWRPDPRAPEDTAFNVSLDTRELSPILAPLQPFAHKLTVVEGLALVSAAIDGQGFQHERGRMHLQTGAMSTRHLGIPTAGARSLDQRVAEVLRADGGLGVFCQSGHDLPPPTSWRDPGTLTTTFFDPVEAHQALFGANQISDAAFEALVRTQGEGAAVFLRAQQDQRLVLDRVRTLYTKVAEQAGVASAKALSDHADLLRQYSQRLQGADATCHAPEVSTAVRGQAAFEAQAELIRTAFACDLTRVATLHLAEMSAAELGLSGNDIHNDWAHYVYADPAADDVMTSFSTMLHARIAHLLAALDETATPSGSLLDETLVLIVPELADPAHGWDRMPVVIAGGGGRVRLGRHIQYAATTPHQVVSPQGETRLMGLPHQRLLTTVAKAVGLDEHIGETTLAGDLGAIDCTGLLPGLLR